VYKSSFFQLEVWTCHTIHLCSKVMKLKIGRGVGVEWGVARGSCEKLSWVRWSCISVQKERRKGCGDVMDPPNLKFAWSRFVIESCKTTYGATQYFMQEISGAGELTAWRWCSDVLPTFAVTAVKVYTFLTPACNGTARDPDISSFQTDFRSIQALTTAVFHFGRTSNFCRHCS